VVKTLKTRTPKKTAPKVITHQAPESSGRFFAYVAPAAIDPNELVERSFLPLNKGVLKTLQQNHLLPRSGDKIIVLRQRDEGRHNYELVFLCSITRDVRKAKECIKHKDKIESWIQYGYRLDIVRESLSDPVQPKRFKILDDDKTGNLPTFQQIQEGIYEKALRAFPLNTLGKRLSKVASAKSLELSKKLRKGWIFDLESKRLVGSNDLLMRISNRALEAAILRRINNEFGYEMVNRLYKAAVKARREELEKMDPFEFEDLCARLVKWHGMQIIQTKRTGDHGVDFYARDSKTRFREGLYIFQVKRTDKVGPEIVQQLESVIRAEDAIKGIIMTTGRFTRWAKKEAESRPAIQLIDGFELRTIIDEIQLSTGTKFAPPNKGATG